MSHRFLLGRGFDQPAGGYTPAYWRTTNLPWGGTWSPPIVYPIIDSRIEETSSNNGNVSIGFSVSSDSASGMAVLRANTQQIYRRQVSGTPLYSSRHDSLGNVTYLSYVATTLYHIKKLSSDGSSVLWTANVKTGNITQVLCKTQGANSFVTVYGYPNYYYFSKLDVSGTALYSYRFANTGCVMLYPEIDRWQSANVMLAGYTTLSSIGKPSLVQITDAGSTASTSWAKYISDAQMNWLTLLPATPACDKSNDILTFTASNGHFIKWSSSGSVIWQKQVTSVGLLVATMDYDGNAWICARETAIANTIVLWKIDTNGAIVWSRKLAPNYIDTSSTQYVAGATSISVSNDVIAVATTIERWDYEPVGKTSTWVNNGTVVNEVLVLPKDGSLTQNLVNFNYASHTTPSINTSSLTIANLGSMGLTSLGVGSWGTASLSTSSNANTITTANIT